MALKNVGKKKGVSTSVPMVAQGTGVKVANLKIAYSRESAVAIASWDFGAQHLKEYKVLWMYKTRTTKGNIWVHATDSYQSVAKNRQSTYDVPDGATAVRCYVIPYSTNQTVRWQTKKKKSKTEDGKKVHYYEWTQHEKSVAYWKGASTYKETSTAGADAPETPSTPVLMPGTGGKVTIGVSSTSGQALKVQLKLYTDGAWASHSGGKAFSSYYRSGEVTVANAFLPAAGHSYRVDARQRNTTLNTWSDYSDFSEIWHAPPTAPTGLTVKTLSAGVVRASWTKTNYSGDDFELRWAQDRSVLLLDDPPSEVETATTDGATMWSTPLAAGTWYFAVRGTVDGKNGAWSAVREYTGWKRAAAPTVSAGASYAASGDVLRATWTYNNTDGSVQTAYEVKLRDSATGTMTAVASGTDATAAAEVDTAGLAVGKSYAVAVRTKGADGAWSDYGYSAAFAVLQPLTVALGVERYDAMPLRLTFSADADVREWHLLVTALESSETVGIDGDSVIVPAGSVAFEGVTGVGDGDFHPRSMTVDLDITEASIFEGVPYRAVLRAVDPHGLADDDSKDFTPTWSGEGPLPTCAIPPVDDDWEAHVFPECRDSEGALVEGVELSVYRIDTDGRPLEIATGLDNDGTVEVVDPHPNFGTCRYRIAARDAQGRMGFYDDEVEVPCDSVLVQFATSSRSYDEEFDPSGAVELPYNIEIDEKHDGDAELAEFIGNSDPTLYTGTQLGRGASTKSDVIRTEDADTIERLRRLADSMQRAYYRDPSGLGFWAWVKVSLSWGVGNSPVAASLEVSRVEGDYSGRMPGVV